MIRIHPTLLPPCPEVTVRCATLHTVLHEPDMAQRQVMDELTRRSDRLVVMARKGAEILRDTYGVALSKVDVIPHGIPDVPFADSGEFKDQHGVAGNAVLLTFGLLGPGKGIEHAIRNVPNLHEGYCTDDNARAFILCNLPEESAIPQRRENLDLLATRYLAFLAAAFHEPSGRFRNFMNHERRWLEEFGSEDSHGRALSAAGSGAARSPQPLRRAIRTRSARRRFLHLTPRMGLHPARRA